MTHGTVRAVEFDEDMSQLGDAEAAQGQKKLVLLILAPSGLHTFDLPAQSLRVVGRGPIAEIVVDHPSISLVHAEVSIGPGGAQLLDLAAGGALRQ